MVGATPQQMPGLIEALGGQQDLHAKVLRHVTDAFREDPVRILQRTFRILRSRIGWCIEPVP